MYFHHFNWILCIVYESVLLLLLSRFSRVWLCDPIDSSSAGPPIPGILQARTLEWVAIAFSNEHVQSKIILSSSPLRVKRECLWEWIWKTSLTVQWLRLHVPNARSTSSIPGQGTKISPGTWHGQKKKEREREWILVLVSFHLPPVHLLPRS